MPISNARDGMRLCGEFLQLASISKFNRRIVFGLPKDQSNMKESLTASFGYHSSLLCMFL